MTKTIYTCDRCGQEQENSRDKPVQFVDVRVACSFGYGETEKIGALWCRQCVDELHLLSAKPRKGEAPKEPQPSLESILREIIREEIQS